jgi:hypothetical protein
MYQFVIPLGIATIICLVMTVLLGLRTNIIQTKIRIKLHIGFATATLILALIHGGIVIYYNLMV